MPSPSLTAEEASEFAAHKAKSAAATGGISNTIINGATVIFNGGIFNFL